MITRTIGGCVRAAVTAAAFAAVVGASSAASAVSFTGSFDVTARNVDPGLVVQINVLLDPLSFDLTPVGDMDTLGLFEIWTNEVDVSLIEDAIPYDIDVAFSFSQPLTAGTVEGFTRGRFLLQDGIVRWDDSIILSFGTNGMLEIELFDTSFALGGPRSTVSGKFTLLGEDSTVIPLPASLPLLMAAFGGLALFRRRSCA